MQLMLIMKKINVTNPIALHMLSCSSITLPCLVTSTPLLYINIKSMITLQKWVYPIQTAYPWRKFIFLLISCCRVRSESCAASSSKACREKLRRDRLNDKYTVYFQIPTTSPVFLLSLCEFLCKCVAEACTLYDGYD